MATFKVCVQKQRKDGFWPVYIRVIQQQEKPFDINEAFDFSQNSDKLRHPSKDGTAELNHVNADNYGKEKEYTIEGRTSLLL